MKKRIVCIMTLLFFCWGSVSMAGPPYTVDDPATEEYHHYSLALSYLSNQIRGAEAQTGPFFSLSYGLRNKIEIGLESGLSSVRTSGIGRKTGVSDTLGTVKWRFKEETARCPQFACGYQIKLPTASRSQGLGTGAADHSVWICSAKSFQRLSMFANLGYNFLGGSDGTNNLFYGFGATYQTTETLVLGAQLYGNTTAAPSTRDELAWGVGLTYNFAPDRTLLLQAGRSAQGFSDLNVSIGLAFTFK